MDSNIKVGDHVLAKVGRNKVEVVVMGIADGRYKVGSLSTGRQFVTANVEPKPAEAAPEPAREPAAPAAAPATAEKPRRGGGRAQVDRPGPCAGLGGQERRGKQKCGKRTCC